MKLLVCSDMLYFTLFYKEKKIDFISFWSTKEDVPWN